MRRNLTAAALLTALATVVFTVGASARTAAAPSNTTPPAVSGTPKIGQTLTVSNGTWTGSPTTYAYQWQRCTSSTACADVAAATKQTYTLVAADAGNTMRAVVTASNADGKSTANSAQTTVVAANGAPASTLPPVILGDAFVGQTLTATNGRWTGSPTSYGYQWLRCDGGGTNCIAIAGATGRTYGVRFEDVYSSLRLDVTAKNANGAATARSDSTDVVQPLEPVVTPGNKAPTIKFLSLRQVGVRVYARFSACDDTAKSVSVVERDSKAGALAYSRRFAVVPNACITATRSWLPASRFRTKGRFVVTLRAVDKSGASSKFVSRSLVRS